MRMILTPVVQPLSRPFCFHVRAATACGVLYEASWFELQDKAPFLARPYRRRHITRLRSHCECH